MKPIALLIALTTLCVLSIHTLSAQTLMFEWAQPMGGSSSQGGGGQSIAIDALGNVYTTGFFIDTIDFDPGEETYNLTSAGDEDCYFQKLDADGNSLWAKRMGGPSWDIATSIAVDAAGNVYTTGWFGWTADFDSESGTDSLTSVGASDIFVQKMDTDGNLVWIKSFGGEQSQWGLSLALDAHGNVYITGWLSGTIDFDPGEGTTIFTAPLGRKRSYVLKLDNDGNFVWAKTILGSEGNQGKSIAVDTFGNVYAIGNFTGTAIFGSEPETVSLISAGSHEIYLQKMDTDGNFVWAKSIEGVGNDWGESVTVDAYGNVYTTGTFTETADFDPGVETFNLTSVGGTDIFVQKLDTDGNFLWAKRMGDTDDDSGISIALDTSGNVYTTGLFMGIADFDPGEGTAILTSAGEGDIFVQKLDAEGNFVWATQMGGEGVDVGYSIAVDAHENIYTTGFFQGTANFDPGVGIVNLTSAGEVDIFVQKIYQCYPTIVPVPHVAVLPNLTAICQITSAPTPLASIDCDAPIIGSPDQTFPITDQSITEIVWTYDDENGNVITQTQHIVWTPVDVTTSITDHTITANNSDGTYQWIDCDNNNAPISGENEQLFTASANGNYAVEITQNGCVETSECISITTVGLSEMEQDIKAIVYPNPSSGIFNIAFEKPIDHTTLTITDMQGKLISTTQIQNASKTSIEINEASGVYLLTIKSKDGQKTAQLIKE